MQNHQSIVDLLQDITMLRRKLQDGRPLTVEEQKSIVVELDALLQDLAVNARRKPLSTE